MPSPTNLSMKLNQNRFNYPAIKKKILLILLNEVIKRFPKEKIFEKHCRPQNWEITESKTIDSQHEVTT